MTYQPFKCPDCKVWWRGETHKCDVTLSTRKVDARITSQHPVYEKPIDWQKSKDWIFCDKCAKKVTKYDWHTCYRGNEYDWHKYKDQPPKRDA